MNTKLLFVLCAFFSTLLLPAQNFHTEEIQLQNDSILLPGTLSIPEGIENPPLVIFIHGSGAIDRDGNQGPALQLGYLKELSEALNAKGIATYRYDKRTSSVENLKRMRGIALQDLVDDVEIAVDYFTEDSRFNSLHLVGHSQGSLLGLLLGEDKLTSYISLAGASRTIDSLMIEQIANQSPLFGEITRLHFKELKETGAIKEVNQNLLQIFSPANQPFLKEWASMDPKALIQGISIPTLIIQGLADIQVPLKEGLGLAAARNPSFTSKAEFKNLVEEKELPGQTLILEDKLNGSIVRLAIIPKLNHICKEVNSLAENQKSYGDPSISLSNELVEVIAGFLNSINE